MKSECDLMTRFDSSSRVTSNPAAGWCWWWRRERGSSSRGTERVSAVAPKAPLLHRGNTRRCLQPHWIFITRQLMNAEQYGSHLRRTTAWECRTPFRPRANIDIDWIKTNIWEGNLASDLKRKFDQEQALSFTYVMQNKYVHVCHCNWYLNGQGWCVFVGCRCRCRLLGYYWDWRSIKLTFLLSSVSQKYC